MRVLLFELFRYFEQWFNGHVNVETITLKMDISPSHGADLLKFVEEVKELFPALQNLELVFRSDSDVNVSFMFFYLLFTTLVVRLRCQ